MSAKSWRRCCSVRLELVARLGEPLGHAVELLGEPADLVPPVVRDAHREIALRRRARPAPPSRAGGATSSAHHDESGRDRRRGSRSAGRAANPPSATEPGVAARPDAAHHEHLAEGRPTRARRAPREDVEAGRTASGIRPAGGSEAAVASAARAESRLKSARVGGRGDDAAVGETERRSKLGRTAPRARWRASSVSSSAPRGRRGAPRDARSRCSRPRARRARALSRASSGRSTATATSAWSSGAHDRR